MLGRWTYGTLGAVALAGICPATQAQDLQGLLALSDPALEDELTQRYDAGLAASQDEAIISANDPRYLWAMETKVQCAIALGYMKSSTRNEPSIARCAEAFSRMSDIPPAPVAAAIPPPPPPPQRRPDSCDDAVAGMVFFDFDSAALRPDAAAALNSVTQNISLCGWNRLSVVGHADQAGSDQYNIGLSRLRANTVADALRSRSVGNVNIEVDARGESEPRVPLADGTRSPQNRRVEITAE